jgi:hypothetical protein
VRSAPSAGRIAFFMRVGFDFKPRRQGLVRLLCRLADP